MSSTKNKLNRESKDEQGKNLGAEEGGIASNAHKY
jgi:hypothetical protein